MIEPKVHGLPTLHVFLSLTDHVQHIFVLQMAVISRRALLFLLTGKAFTHLSAKPWKPLRESWVIKCIWPLGSLRPTEQSPIKYSNEN